MSSDTSATAIKNLISWFKFTRYFGPEEFNVTESTNVLLLLLQLCTLLAPKFPVQKFHIAAMLNEKKISLAYTWNIVFYPLMDTADKNATM